MNFPSPLSNSQKEKLFQYTFSKLLVFTILFEDSDVDEQIFNVNDESKVLSISGAGCGVAGMLAKNPRTIDALDSNLHHLAVAAIKCQAAQAIHSYDEFYNLLGVGKISNPEDRILKLANTLPPALQKYWKRNYGYFRSGLYRQGLFARYASVLRILSGIDEHWLKELSELPKKDRLRMGKEKIGSFLEQPIITRAVDSPLMQLAHGINFQQKKRNLESWNTTQMRDIFLNISLEVSKQSIKDNWILWHMFAGRFNVDNKKCLPPYLRKKSHRLSTRGSTSIRYHHRNIFDCMSTAGKSTWTHFYLSDAIDWMPRPVQTKLFREVLRTAEDGGYLLYRTVENKSLIAEAGLNQHFELVEPSSSWASENECTKLYKRVNLYRIHL